MERVYDMILESTTAAAASKKVHSAVKLWTSLSYCSLKSHYYLPAQAASQSHDI